METDPPFILALFSLLLASTTLTSSLSPHPTPIPIPMPTTPSPTPSTSPTPPSTTTTPTTLDPKQLRALQSLNIPTSKDPCSTPSLNPNTTTCDSSKPFRHLLSLTLSNCSSSLQISTTALKSLSTLTSLHFLNCPDLPLLHLPPSLSSSLLSFSSINSLKKLTGVWLSRLHNLTDLTLSSTHITASGPTIILSAMKSLHSVTISHTNLTGYLPKHFHLNLTHIDLSSNQLIGKIPDSLTLLENLQTLNLSSNSLIGEIPTSIGDLLYLQNLSLSSNSLSGPIPDSMAEIPGLQHLDLGSNQLNGTIPKFISQMKGLKYLNLEKNSFRGVMPFNASFIKQLVVFKIGGNTDLCFNHSTISSKLKLGIAPCDKHGLPIPPPPAKESSSNSRSSGVSSDDDYSDGEESNHKEEHHHGPSKVVLGVAIGLSSIVFLIVFLVLLSKWCG